MQTETHNPPKFINLSTVNSIWEHIRTDNEIQYFELVNNYESSIHDYETSINQIDEKWLKMEEEKRFLETNINNSKITMYSMAGIYSYNLIDIIFSLNKFSQRGEFGWIIPIETKFGISEGTINFTCSIYLE